MQAQRDQVTIAEAEAKFAAGEHEAAARLWGRIAGGGPSFEETALRFVDVGATSALQAFLLARLKALGPDDRAQARAAQRPLLPLNAPWAGAPARAEGALPANHL